MQVYIRVALPCVLTYLAVCGCAVRPHNGEVGSQSLIATPSQSSGDEPFAHARSSADGDAFLGTAGEPDSQDADAHNRFSSDELFSSIEDDSGDAASSAASPAVAAPFFACDTTQSGDDRSEEASGGVSLCSRTPLALGHWDVSFGGVPKAPSSAAAGAGGDTTEFFVRHYTEAEEAAPPTDTEASASRVFVPSTEDRFSLGLFVVATGPRVADNVLRDMTQYADATMGSAMKGQESTGSSREAAIVAAINALFSRLVELLDPSKVMVSQTAIGIVAHDIPSDRVYIGRWGKPVILVKPRDGGPPVEPQTVWSAAQGRSPRRTMEEMLEAAGFDSFRLQRDATGSKRDGCFLFTLRKTLELPAFPQQLVAPPTSKRRLGAVTGALTTLPALPSKGSSGAPWGRFRGRAFLAHDPDHTPPKHGSYLWFHPVSADGAWGNRGGLPFLKVSQGMPTFPSFLGHGLQKVMNSVKNLYGHFKKDFADMPGDAWGLKHSMQIQFDFCELTKADATAPATETATTAPGIVFGTDADRHYLNENMRTSSRVATMPRIDLIQQASAAIDYTVLANFGLVYPYWKQAHEQVYTERQVAKDKEFIQDVGNMVQPWLVGREKLTVSRHALDRLTQLETTAMDRCITDMYNAFAPFIDDAAAWSTSGQSIAEAAHALGQGLEKRSTTTAAPPLADVQAMIVKFSMKSGDSTQ